MAESRRAEWCWPRSGLAVESLVRALAQCLLARSRRCQAGSLSAAARIAATGAQGSGCKGHL
eukprot:9212470-Alexandrium_andersonii.AAC.1